MALTPEQLSDLSAYQLLLQTLVRILDGEAVILAADRQLSSGNITAINDVVTDVVGAIDDITTSNAL